MFNLSFAGIGVEVGGFGFEPEEERGDLGVLVEGFEGVEFPFQSFFCERGVEEVVTAFAEPGECLSDVLAVEVTSDAAVVVSGFGDEVVGGQVGDLTVAEFTGLVWASVQGRSAGER